MTTTFLSPPPHLLPSSTPHLLNSTALWYPQWTKYLLNSSPPHLLNSTALWHPSGQNTFSTPHLLNSTALWYPQWTKYLLTSSPLQIRCSLVPPVDKMPPLLNSTALGRPKWPPTCSLAAQVDKIPPLLLNFATFWHPKWPHPTLGRPKWATMLFGAPSSAIWRLSWQPPLLSSATSGNTNQMDHILLLLGMLFLVFKIYFFIRMIKCQETISSFCCYINVLSVVIVGRTLINAVTTY